MFRRIPFAERVFGALLLLPALAGCGGADAAGNEDGAAADAPSLGSGNRRPVVLISIDSLRADHCTPYGYTPQFTSEPTTPFLARMAEEGVLFENCSSASSWTLPSHLSMLTGMPALEHGVDVRGFRLRAGTKTLASPFQAAGYHTAGFYSAPFLHPAFGYDEGFDTYRGAMPYLNALQTDEALKAGTPGALSGVHHQADSDVECSEQVVDQALAWLAEENRFEEPFFLFLHLWDPHYDYVPPQDYAERFHPGYRGSVDGRQFYSRWQEADARGEEQRYSDEDLEHYLALYDAEIRYTDDQIARLHAQFEQWGIGDDVILAIVSDHGDEFYEHGQLGHHKTLHEEVLAVPMVVRAKGLAPAGTRVSASVGNYDLAPTLLALGGFTPWPDRGGRSLLPLFDDADAEGLEVVARLIHPGRKLWMDSWRLDDDKVLVRHLNHRRGKPKILTHVDLGADPGEHAPTTVDGPNEHPVAGRAWKTLGALAGRKRRPDTMEESEAMTNSLSDLGYVDDPSEDEEAEDPQAKVPSG